MPKYEPLNMSSWQNCGAGACANTKIMYVPKRYIIVILTCLGMAIAHAMRVNVAVTVVTILNNKEHTEIDMVEGLATVSQRNGIKEKGLNLFLQMSMMYEKCATELTMC